MDNNTKSRLNKKGNTLQFKDDDYETETKVLKD